MKRVFRAACCCAVLGSLSVGSSFLLAQKKAGGMTDQQFVDFAAQTDMVEANLGQYAQTAASSQAVKDYGQKLTTDHTADYGQLGTAAQAANLKVPTAIDSEHDKMMIAPMEKLKGAAFDHKYAMEMVEGHTKAIAVYEKEAKDASSSDVKAYAEKALPTLKDHLSAAKELEKPAAKKM
jgi:putative membrane protein